VEDPVVGFAALAVFSSIGILVAVGWVVMVSIAIRRDDRGAVTDASATELTGRVTRMSRQATGVHWV
jgi:hypothetical protein